MDSSGGVNQVGEGILYFLLWIALAVWSILVTRNLANLNSKDARKVQPFYVTFLMVWCLIGIFVYSAFQVFDYDVTWRTLSCCCVIMFSSLEAITGLMVLEYFTEVHRIERLAKFLEKRTKRSKSVPSASPQTPRGGNLYQIKTKLIESSFCFKFCFVVVVTIIGSTPLIVLAYSCDSMTSFFKDPIVVQNKPWIFCSFFTGCTAAFSFCAILTWIHCRLRKIGKTVSFWELLQKYILSGVIAGVIAVVVYATPLAKWSHETFDFKPLVVVILPYVYLLYRLSILGRRKFAFGLPSSPRSLNSFSVGSEAVIKEEMLATLNDAEGYQLVFQAARKELSLENLMFYTTIQDWKAIKEPELKQSRAKYICDSFFTTGSDCSVNVSYKSRLAITNKINLASGEVPSDIFDEALQEILKLILWDTYMRVRNSKEFAEYSKNRAA